MHFGIHSRHHRSYRRIQDTPSSRRPPEPRNHIGSPSTDPRPDRRISSSATLRTLRRPDADIRKHPAHVPSRPRRSFGHLRCHVDHPSPSSSDGAVGSEPKTIVANPGRPCSVPSATLPIISSGAVHVTWHPGPQVVRTGSHFSISRLDYMVLKPKTNQFISNIYHVGSRCRVLTPDLGSEEGGGRSPPGEGDTVGPSSSLRRSPHTRVAQRDNSREPGESHRRF